MANRYSIGSGLASSPAIWDGGATVPVSGDRVLISAGHTVEIDGTYEWGDDSTATVSINAVSTTASVFVKGTLKASRTAASSLTTVGSLYVMSGATLDYGTAASPIPAATPAVIYAGKAAVPADSKYGFYPEPGAIVQIYGATKIHRAQLTATAAVAATTILVNQASGWLPGDTIYLSSGSATSGVKYETAVVHASYTPGSTTVPLTAGLTYDHLISTHVANITNSVTIQSHSAGPTTTSWGVIYSSTADSVAARAIRYVSLVNFNGYNTNGSFLRGFVVRDTNTVNDVYSALSDIVIYNPAGNVGFNAVYSRRNVDIPRVTAIASTAINGSDLVNFTDPFLAGDTGFSEAGNVIGPVYTNPVFTSRSTGGGLISRANGSFVTIRGGYLYGPGYSAFLITRASDYLLDGVDMGKTAPCFTMSGFVVRFGGFVPCNITLKDCQFATGTVIPIVADMSNFAADSRITVLNRNADVTQQEEYSSTGTLVRNNATVKRSTSSLAIKPNTVGSDRSREVTIPCANNATIRVVGYCQFDTSFYNTNNYNAPTVTISGLGITPQTYTATVAANGAWEAFDISATNNVVGYDGNFTLTFNANAKAATTGTVYFDGVPDSPFVTKCRHYGFAFNESSPVRTVNPTISAAEATAAAYTGISVSGGAAQSDVTVTADNTFQKLYDYTQAWACLNLASAVPVTGSGVAGSPVLFAAGAVTINTTKVLNGAGSLSTGAFTLTAELNGGATYTYTGGSFSRASTLDSFNGGQLNIGAAGTYVFSMTDARINVTPTGASTYNLASGTFTGAINVRNTSVHAITVEIPAGSSFNSTGNTGGAITFSAPSVYQSATVTGFTTGSRLQFYDVQYAFTVSGVTITPTAGATYTDANGVTYTVRSASITAGSGTVTAYGLAFPPDSGTLTKTGGTGDATLTFSAYADTGTSLANATASSGNVVISGSSAVWTDPVAAADVRAIRARIAYVSGVTANTFLEAFIGACATSGAGKDISYIANQTANASYNTNAIDGPIVYAASGITFTDAATDLINCNVAGGSLTHPTTYACFQYWLFTATGIANNFTDIGSPDPANYIYTNMKFKNTSSPSVGLSISGGWGRDSVTGLSITLWDTTGGTIGFSGDHAVAYSSGSGLTAGQAASLATIESSVGVIQPKVTELHLLDGLDVANPLAVNNDSNTRTAGAIEQSVVTVGNVTTVTRV